MYHHIKKAVFSTMMIEEVSEVSECTSYTIQVHVPTNFVFGYTPCGGSPTSITLNGDNTTHPAEATLCIKNGSLTLPPPSSQWSVFFGDACAIPFLEITQQPSDADINDTNQDTDTPIVSNPPPYSGNIANAERGFYKHIETWSNSYSNLSSVTLASYQASFQVKQILRMIYIPTFLNKDMDSEDPDFTSLEFNMNYDFSALRESGTKAYIRFAYTDEQGVEGDLTHNPDLPRLQNHIDMLSPILIANKDVISGIHFGFIGAWGEQWYTDFFGWQEDQLLPANVLKRNQLLKYLLDATQDIFVLVRTPKFKTDFLDFLAESNDAIDILNAFDGSYKSRIGYHNDAFEAEDENNAGTWTNRPLQEPIVIADTEFVPIMGEAYDANNNTTWGTNCSNATQELSRLNYRSLNMDYHLDVVGPSGDYATGGCLQAIKESLGYRFYMVEQSLPTQVKAMLPIHFVIKNEGYGNVFHIYQPIIVLSSTTALDEYEFEVNSDVRFWKDNIFINQNIDISDVPPGTYNVFLLIRYSANSDAQHCIRIANDIPYNTGNGRHNLSNVITVLPTTVFSASFTVYTNGTPTYQWQVNDGFGWVNVVNGLSGDVVYFGANTSTLNISHLTGDQNGWQYRVVCSDGYETVTSNPATLNIL